MTEENLPQTLEEIKIDQMVDALAIPDHSTEPYESQPPVAPPKKKRGRKPKVVPPPVVVVPEPEPVKATRKPRSKPVPKAFKGASSYAEKRLAEAIKERAEAMGKVAMLNAEIPSLVQIIKALGSTQAAPVYDFSAMMPLPASYDAQVPMAAPYTPPAMRQQAAQMPTSQISSAPLAMGGTMEAPELMENEDEDQFLKVGGVVGGGKWS